METRFLTVLEVIYKYRKGKARNTPKILVRKWKYPYEFTCVYLSIDTRINAYL